MEWLHSYYGAYANQQVQFNSRTLALPKHEKIGFDVFEHGIVKRRVFQGYTEEDDDWKHGHPVLFPNILAVGSQASATLQFRVPMDETHTYHVSLYTWQAAPGTQAPTQDVVPYRYVPLTGNDGRYITNALFNQDFTVWISQGPLALREREKLGESDRGIILFRKQLREQLDIVADGGDPMNVIRDPEKNARLLIPMEQVKFGMKRAAAYIAAESGRSADADKIDAVIETWADVADPAPAGHTGP